MAGEMTDSHLLICVALTTIVVQKYPKVSKKEVIYQIPGAPFLDMMNTGCTFFGYVCIVLVQE
jgi:hypothetical protein